MKEATEQKFLENIVSPRKVWACGSNTDSGTKIRV